MRHEVEAHAELADALCLLENLDFDALFVQAKRRAEAADAATDHERLHRTSLHPARRKSAVGRYWSFHHRASAVCEQSFRAANPRLDKRRR